MWELAKCDRCGADIVGGYYAFMRVTDDEAYEEITLCEKCGKEALKILKEWVRKE